MPKTGPASYPGRVIPNPQCPGVVQVRTGRSLQYESSLVRQPVELTAPFSNVIPSAPVPQRKPLIRLNFTSLNKAT
ncbi:hypothetical protein WN944_003648 [Citrus x changshan-huyou]|uniref:Uncharacterized protein n=1 Tax=Citrus x changshan-huyou TaxID=2935761 RepID=A0AAP0LZL9_9ROSI